MAFTHKFASADAGAAPGLYLEGPCYSDEACLVGGIPTTLKNDGVKVSWDDDIPYTEK